MEALRTSETSVNTNLTTRRYIPEDSKLHTRCRENLKSHTVLALLHSNSESHYEAKTCISQRLLLKVFEDECLIQTQGRVMMFLQSPKAKVIMICVNM
jgi:hypothetical protein